MSNRGFGLRSFRWVLPSLLVLACGLMNVRVLGTEIEVSTTPTVSDRIPTVIITNTQAVPVAPSTVTVVITASAQPVTITAMKGSVFIRRGPDQAFNPISALMIGQSATASARDVLAGWIRISIPDKPGKTGWISIKTQYTVVTGDVMTLPEMEPTEWPELASIRNCTHHQMWIEPAHVILPSVDNFPANDLRVNPGTYTIYDTDVDDYPEVMKITVWEGNSVDLRYDGNGEKKKCPVP